MEASARLKQVLRDRQNLEQAKTTEEAIADSAENFPLKGEIAGYSDGRYQIRLAGSGGIVSAKLLSSGAVTRGSDLTMSNGRSPLLSVEQIPWVREEEVAIAPAEPQGPVAILFERILNFDSNEPILEYWLQVQKQSACRLLEVPALADGPTPPGGGGPGGDPPDPPGADDPEGPFNDPALPYVVQPPASGVESQFYEVVVYLTSRRDGFNPDWAKIDGATDGFNWGNPRTSTVVGRVFLFGPIIGISPGVATQFGQEPQPENLEFGGQVAPNTNALTIHHADNQRTPGNSEVLSFSPDNLLDMINSSRNKIIDVGFVSIKPIPPDQNEPNPDEPPFPSGPEDDPFDPFFFLGYDPVNDPPPPPEEDPPPEDEQFDRRFNWPWLTILSQTEILVQVMVRAEDYPESSLIDVYTWLFEVNKAGEVQSKATDQASVTENSPIAYSILPEQLNYLFPVASGNAVPQVYADRWQERPDSNENFATLNIDKDGNSNTVLGSDRQQWKKFMPNDQAFGTRIHVNRDGDRVEILANYEDFGYANEVAPGDSMIVYGFKEG